MKLNNLKQKLMLKNTPSPLRIDKDSAILMQNEFYSYKLNEKNVNHNLKIIGITGSAGKSTTAYLIHNYLKLTGYRSILYSSIEIDSPTSYNARYEAVENPLRNEKMLLDAIVQAEAYQADYLVLEVNERSIARGYTKDIPFNIRLITNIYPTHNNIFYPPEEYVEIKKSFFKDIPEDEDCICIYGLGDRAIFDSLTTINTKPKKLFGSQYVAQLKGVSEDKFDYLLYGKDIPLDTINGLDISFRIGENHDRIITNMIMPFNALNILASIAVLDTLKIYDSTKYKEMIANFKIPGRDEKTEVKGRKIIVNSHLIPELEILKKYKERNEIKKIKVVVGAIGEGYKHWVKEFSEQTHKEEREHAIQFAYDYIKKYADYVYITTTDLGASDAKTILEKQENLLGNLIPHETHMGRKEAIRKAIMDSQEGDVIFISGRGNRRILCDSKDTFKLHVDQEVVDEILKEINWKF